MGERALAACKLSSCEYHCYNSQWGACEGALRSAFSNNALDLCAKEWSYRGRRSWSGLVEGLDYLQFEALYQIATDQIATYLPVWLGFGPATGTDPASGVLVSTSSFGEFRHRRAALRRMKSELGQAIESGDLAPETAAEKLRSELINRGWSAQECYCEHSE